MKCCNIHLLCAILFLFFAGNVQAQNTYAACIKKAYQLIENREYATAQTYFEKAAQLNPKKGEPWYGKCICLYNAADKLDAINKAIQLEPNVGKYYHTRADIYNGMDKYDERLADFQKWVAVEPNNGEAHFELSFALRRKNPSDPSIREHVKKAMQLIPNDTYSMGLLKNNFPSLYTELQAEIDREKPAVAVEEKPAPAPAEAPSQPVPTRKKTNKSVPAKKTVPEAPVVVIDEAASQFVDSCATVFSSSIDRWASQMANRSDIITAFSGCGSSDCRQKKFGELNSLLTEMSDNLSNNIYVLLYRNDSRLKNACSSLGSLLGNAKWKFSDAANKYESAATFAINLKKSYNDLSGDQRGQFIQLMFNAYDEADVVAQEGMKMLMDAYESYLDKTCPSLKPGSTFANGNIIYQSLANAQAYLKIKLDDADAKQQQNLADAEKKKKAEEAAKKKKTVPADANDVAKTTACSCCKGKGYTTKQVAEFHKMSEKRVERVKKIENGKAITEVTYEPIGYTKYKTVKETCSCCSGTGKKE